MVLKPTPLLLVNHSEAKILRPRLIESFLRTNDQNDLTRVAVKR